MKTSEELNTLKTEFENLSKELAELSEEELSLIAGGGICGFSSDDHDEKYSSPTIDNNTNYGGICGFSLDDHDEKYPSPTIDNNTNYGGICGNADKSVIISMTNPDQNN